MTIYLTPEGKTKLEKELEKLVARRPIITQKIARAKEMGDLSENAEYHDAKDEQGFVESRIREIEATLREAEVVEKTNGSDIGIGSEIIVEINGSVRNYLIVGANEASPAEGKISGDSPLGKAFLGRKKGDEVQIKVPAGEMVYKIRDVK